MRAPSGHEVYFDTPMLTSALPSEKQAMLGSIINGMAVGDIVAGYTAFWLGNDPSFRNEPRIREPKTYPTETAHGAYRPSESLKWLQDPKRLRGFVGAIKRWDQQDAVIDVGSGPFPVLALAAAVYHPAAHITAVEINPRAAAKAAAVVEMFELSDRLHVICGDIADHTIDANTSAAVTETFGPGISYEPGPKIVRLLHTAGVPVITPSRAELCLDVDGSSFFSQVDLRKDSHGSVEFDNPTGAEGGHIRAAYYDDAGLVLDYEADTITSRLSIGGLSGPLPVPKGRLTYELGCKEPLPQFDALDCVQTIDRI